MPDRLPPELRAALATLTGTVIGEPCNAADWARAALTLIEAGRHELAEACTPSATMHGWTVELLRAVAALAQGREPPPPLDWDTRPRKRRRKAG